MLDPIVMRAEEKYLFNLFLQLPVLEVLQLGSERRLLSARWPPLSLHSVRPAASLARAMEMHRRPLANKPLLRPLVSSARPLTHPRSATWLSTRPQFLASPSNNNSSSSSFFNNNRRLSKTTTSLLSAEILSPAGAKMPLLSCKKSSCVS
jgi:hypothetical protein